jgi:lysophospholipase L1-like esterase
VAAVLLALDRIVAWTDLGYRAARAKPSEDRWLARPEFGVRVVTNALGFREPRLPSPKPAGVVRVVALGDSFTQGYGVAEDEAYPRRVEALLAAHDPSRRYEVVNLGVPGTSPRDYLGHLRDPGLAYAPDVVVVGVMANDVQDVWIQRRFGVQFAVEVLHDVQRELADGRPLWRRAPARLFPALYPFVWTRVDAIRQALATTTAPRPAAAGTPEPAHARPALAPDRWREVVLEMGDRFGRRAEVAHALDRAPAHTVAAVAPVATGAVALDSDAGVDGWERLLALVEPRLFADAVLLPPAYDAAWTVTERTLASIVRVARGAGARVVLVYVPAIHQVTDAGRAWLERTGFEWDPRTLVDTTFPDRLRRFGEREGVPVVDLLAVFRARRDARRLYFPEDGHWTPAGHAVAADAIAAAVGPLLAR